MPDEPPRNESLTLDLKQRIDQICDRFEAAWKSGQRPQIEVHLDGSEGRPRAELLRELLVLDCEYRARLGERLSIAEYESRFPGDAWVIREALEKVSSLLGRASDVETVDWSRTARSTVETSSAAPASADAPAADDAAVGPSRTFGRFQILELLGRGGFGAVYRARDPQLDREVALKIPRAGALVDAEDRERFLREARAAAQLRHPHIVPVHESGQIRDSYYIASQFIHGRTLRRELRARKRFARRDAVVLVVTLAEALQHAHNRGIVHRDIKPENILIDESGRPYVTDFGLARRDQGEVLHTQEGAQVGTPAYMSPEQAGGQSHLADARSDLWSLGVVLYELLTGRRPFEGNIGDLLQAVLRQDPPGLRSLDRSIPKDLETICLKCLAKDPEKRFASCQHLADELNRWLAGRPIESRPTSLAERSVRWCRRNPLPAATAMAALIGLASTAAYMLTRPAYLELHVRPAEARVRFGNQAAVLTDGRALLTAAPGRHELVAELEGYVPVRQDVLLMRGRDNAAVVDLELRSNFGYVQIDSLPPGADVELVAANDQVMAQGVTPYHSPRLPAGPLTVHLKKEFHGPQKATLAVPDGDRTTVLPAVKLELLAQGLDSLERFRRQMAALERPLARPLEFVDTPLVKVLTFLQDSQKLPMQLDNSSPDTVGLSGDMPVTIKVQGVSLGSALATLLEPWNLAAIPLEGNEIGVLVTTKERAEAQVFTVFYPVGDLVQTARGVVDYSWLIGAITTNIAPTTWREVGGVGTITEMRNVEALSVTQSWFVHHAILNYLTDARRISGTAQGVESLERFRRLMEAVDRPLAAPLRFNNAPLTEVIDYLQQSQQLTIHLDAKSLEEAGLATNMPVTVDVAGGRLSDALEKTFGPLGLAAIPLQPGQELVLRITTRERADGTFYTVLYPVGDLLGTASGSDLDYAPLISGITNKLSPNTWSQVGGAGSMSVLNNAQALSVSQTWSVHRQIFNYLIDARKNATTAPKPARTTSKSIAPDRRAAEWVLAVRGTVTIVVGQKPPIKLFHQHGQTPSPLPAEPFEVRAIQLTSRTWSQEDLDNLAGLRAIETLELFYTGLSDVGWARIQGLASLKTLNIGQTSITDAGLAHVAELPALENLGLSQATISNAGLAHLTGTRLITLNLTSTAISDAGLAHLAGISSLTSLTLDYTRVTDAGLEQLAKCKNLAFLSLGGTAVSDAGLAHLRSCPRLQTLYLWSTRITDAGLEHLAALPTLNALSLNFTAVTDAGLARLGPDLNRFVGLWLWNTKVSDETLTRLAGAIYLKQLNLAETRATGAGLQHLSKLQELEYLGLSHLPVADEDLRYIAGLSQLNNLDLSSTQITNASCDLLGQLQNLKTLQVPNTGLTAEGVKTLRSALPQCRIEN